MLTEVIVSFVPTDKLFERYECIPNGFLTVFELLLYSREGILIDIFYGRLTSYN